MEVAMEATLEPSPAPSAEARNMTHEAAVAEGNATMGRQDDWPSEKRNVLAKQASIEEPQTRTSRLSRSMSSGSVTEAGQRGGRMSRMSGDVNYSEYDWKEPKEIKGTFVDAAAMKDKVRQNLMRPQWNVVDLYKERERCWWARVAVSPYFDQVTLLVIFINAVWIGYDTDENRESVLTNAQPTFIVAENLFCTFFSFEWLVRFMSFRRKIDGLKDQKFMFDTFMVLMMVLETWVLSLLVLTIYESANSGNSGVLGVFKLLRLTRLVRMARLLRAMPELMIMIKGMIAAIRSVYFTLLLLLIITYVFAITLVQLTQGSTGGDMYFPDVLYGMWVLVVHGCLIDSVQKVTRDLSAEPIYINGLFVMYILLSHLTVLNMLIGVLCEVVSAVAATEKEEMLVNYVNTKLQKVVRLVDTDGGGSISKKEFQTILENAEAVRCLQDVGVDVIGLVDIADFIFDEEACHGDQDGDEDSQAELTFAKFMELVLQLRGSNNATVKDVVDLRKYVRTAVTEIIPKSVAAEFRRHLRSDGTLRTKTMSRTFTNQSMGASPSLSPSQSMTQEPASPTLSPQTSPRKQITRTLTNVSVAPEPHSRELAEDSPVCITAALVPVNEPKMITASFVAPLSEPKMTQPQTSVFCEGPTLLFPNGEGTSRKSPRLLLEPPPFDVPESGEGNGEGDVFGERGDAWLAATLSNPSVPFPSLPSAPRTPTPRFPGGGPGGAGLLPGAEDSREDELWQSVYALANALCGRLELLRAVSLHAGLAASAVSAQTGGSSSLLASASFASGQAEVCTAMGTRRCMGGSTTTARKRLHPNGGEDTWC